MGHTPSNPPADEAASHATHLPRGRRGARRQATVAVSPQTQSELRRCERHYAMELARSASHISSALGVESAEAEIARVVERFRGAHGDDDLVPFLCALGARVETRGHALGATLLQRVITAESTARAMRAPRSA